MKRSDVTRRDLLKTAALVGAAVAGGVSSRSRPAHGAEGSVPASAELDITVAGYDFDRVKALVDGKVSIRECETKFEVSTVGEMNTHIFSGPQTREVTEIGLHPFMLAWANDGFRDYTLIPVFPLRVFRHRSIFIRTDRGIDKPEHLRGKKIATPGFSSTSLTWIRGILQHEYGVKPREIEWVIAAQDSSAGAAGNASKQERVVPEGLSVESGPAGKDESELLADGDVDALFHAAEPRAYLEGHPKIGRLFPDSRKTERAYFEKTGIFPIMHAVAIRKDVAKQNPWLPQAVFEAYSSAKQQMYTYLQATGWYNISLPWVGQELESTRALMGDNYWPYGIEPNRKALETLFQYSYEQGLAKQKLEVEEVFHPSTLALVEDGG